MLLRRGSHGTMWSVLAIAPTPRYNPPLPSSRLYERDTPIHSESKNLVGGSPDFSTVEAWRRSRVQARDLGETMATVDFLVDR
jgi:hypothetical protein